MENRQKSRAVGEAADKSKKYLFEVVEYEEKHSVIVGSGQRTKNCQSMYPYFKPSGSEIFEEYQKTRDDICDNDDLEANEDEYLHFLSGKSLR